MNPNNFIHPFTCLIAGPTGCGKTQFIVQLLKSVNKFIIPNPKRIIYCYTMWQDKFDYLKKIIPEIEFNDGL
jgi:predicted AAA+ superfamily ATPase